MNALQQLQATAGQKVHEAIYGATLFIFGKEIPCTSTKVEKNFDMMEGGPSATTFVKAMGFRTELIGTNVAAKGEKCQLEISDGGETFKMQLWHGGPLPGGLVQQFMLVDANYKSG